MRTMCQSSDTEKADNTTMVSDRGERHDGCISTLASRPQLNYALISNNHHDSCHVVALGKSLRSRGVPMSQLAVGGIVISQRREDC